MDTYLTIVSRRETRDYSHRQVEDGVVDRVVEAGRLSGSSKNRQLWRFVLIRQRSTLEALAKVVTRPTNLETASFAIGILLEEGGKPFDAGRAAQNMMLAAWNEGVGSCPNTIKDMQRFSEIVGIDDADPATLLSFGYPRIKVSPERRDPEDWIEAADRKPREAVVSEL